MKELTTENLTKVSLNAVVFVSLTDLGWKLLRKEASRTFDGNEDRIEDYMKNVYKDKKTVIGDKVFVPFVFWEFMKLFGEFLFHGMSSNVALFDIDTIYFKND